MKLPRWLVILMLTSIVLAVLAAAGWWWITWPERTARTFVNHLAGKRWRELTPTMSVPGFVLQADDAVADTVNGEDQDHRARSRIETEELAGHDPSAHLKDSLEVEPQSRSISDLLWGRGAFKATGDRRIAFVAERGRITKMSWSVFLIFRGDREFDADTE